jgi:hypothetical protein
VSLQRAPLPPRPPLPRVPWLSCHRRRRCGRRDWSSSLAIGGGDAAHQAEAQLTEEEAQLTKEVARPRKDG